MKSKIIDWEVVDKMLIAGCNGVQCAASIGVHAETLYDRCKLEKNTVFSVYAQDKRAHGDALLHAAQYEKAYQDKHPTMLIWLGKQRLNQKEDLDRNEDLQKMGEKFDEIIAQFSSEPSKRNIEESSTSNEQKS